jgi:hypothetical protein
MMHLLIRHIASALIAVFLFPLAYQAGHVLHLPNHGHHQCCDSPGCEALYLASDNLQLEEQPGHCFVCEYHYAVFWLDHQVFHLETTTCTPAKSTLFSSNFIDRFTGLDQSLRAPPVFINNFLLT